MLGSSFHLQPLWMWMNHIQKEKADVWHKVGLTSHSRSQTVWRNRKSFHCEHTLVVVGNKKRQDFSGLNGPIRRNFHCDTNSQTGYLWLHSSRTDRLIDWFYSNDEIFSFLTKGQFCLDSAGCWTDKNLRANQQTDGRKWKRISMSWRFLSFSRLFISSSSPLIL